MGSATVWLQPVMNIFRRGIDGVRLKWNGSDRDLGLVPGEFDARLALGHIEADLPALKFMIGCAGHSAKFGCFRCSSVRLFLFTWNST
jgi:hypothetical protein